MSFETESELSILTTSKPDDGGGEEESMHMVAKGRKTRLNWPCTILLVAVVALTLVAASTFIWGRLAGTSANNTMFRRFDPTGFIHALAEPNPPQWPPSVKVFGPGEDPAEISRIVINAFTQNGGQQPPDHGQFSQARFAFLFRPGVYNVEVPVGYYTQVLGLGGLPDDVTFISAKGVYSEQGNKDYKVGALNSFWRSAENFRSNASYQWIDYTPQAYHEPPIPIQRHGMLWAVSQAAPLRRILVERDLILFEDAYEQVAGRASGGFMANVQVRGGVMFGSQQQWLTRNADIGSSSNSNWNTVFVGVNGAPIGQCGNVSNSYVTVDEAPSIAEKPFISIDSLGKYSLRIPHVRAHRRGTLLNHIDDSIVSFDSVYVAKDTDTAAYINSKLSAGLHVVLSPGIYHLDEPLYLVRESQVLLGIGFATLLATAGNALIHVGDVGGVRIAGVLLEAGPKLSNTLLVWGSVGYPGNAANPGFLHDVFVRVGGSSKLAKAGVMLRVNAGHVIGDNVWLWRADHGNGYVTKGGENPCKMGAVISGDDVIMYGLFAEHSLQDQVQWSGQRGRVYLLQTELPYDAGPTFGSAGYAGLRVNDSVISHTAYGVGVYHFFRDYPVTVASGVVAPTALEAFFYSTVGIGLAGQGTMRHVLNNLGDETSDWRNKQYGFHPAYVCPPLAGAALVAFS